MMVDLSGQDIPRLAASLQLASESANLASQGPALLASSSVEALQGGSKKMRDAQEIVAGKLGEIIELGADKNVISALSQTVKNIEDTIKDLGAAAGQRLETSAKHEKQYDALRKAHANFVAVANPAMMDAQARTNAILLSANLLLDDATEAARTIELLGNVISSSNLLASDMMAALSANNSAALDPIEGASRHQQLVKSNLEALGKGAGTTKLRDASLKLLALGEGGEQASLKFVRGNWTLSNPVRSYSRIPSSSTRNLRQACSNSWLACRPIPLPRLGRRVRRFRWRPRSCWHLAA